MTDIGACVQDWSMAPCPSHGACAGCGDHLVVKGNATHKTRAERLLAEHESMLAQAKAEMDEGTLGASNWVAHNDKMVAGLKKTIAVHDDRGITDGSIVQV
jgi:IS5 family transposase